MRQFMLERSMRGLGLATGPEAILTGSDVTWNAPPKAPPDPMRVSSVSRTIRVTSTIKPSSSLVAAPRSASVPSSTKVPGASLLRNTRITTGPMLGASGGARPAPTVSPTSEAAGADAAMLDDAAAVRGDAADPSVPSDASVIYGSSGSVTENSAFADWWLRYRWWALSVGGGAAAAFVFWMMQRRRR